MDANCARIIITGPCEDSMKLNYYACYVYYLKRYEASSQYVRQSFHVPFDDLLKLRTLCLLCEIIIHS